MGLYHNYLTVTDFAKLRGLIFDEGKNQAKNYINNKSFHETTLQ